MDVRRKAKLNWIGGICESFSFPIRHEIFLTYLGELFGEGSPMDVRIWSPALKLSCQEALLLRVVQEDSWNPSTLIS